MSPYSILNSEFDHGFSNGAGRNRGESSLNVTAGETLLGEKWSQFAGICENSGAAKDFAVTGEALTREERQ